MKDATLNSIGNQHGEIARDRLTQGHHSKYERRSTMLASRVSNLNQSAVTETVASFCNA